MTGKLLVSANEERLNKLKNSYFMQGFIAVLSILVMLIYFTGLLVQFSSIFAILDKNTRMFESYDGDVKKIQEFTVNKDGSAEVILKNGKIIELAKDEYTVAYMHNKDRGESYYHEDCKTILTEIDKNYDLELFKSGKTYLICLFIVFTGILTRLGRDYKMKILGSNIYFLVMCLLDIYAALVVLLGRIYI